MKLTFLFLAFFVGFIATSQNGTKVILDADTGNEVDDLYAIVRAFAHPSWDIVALNATQWQDSQWAVDHTMEESHRLNEVLISYLKKNDEVKLLRGGFRRMYDWGDEAQHSAAAYEIIKLANKQEEGSKLMIVALGALTNVASALYIDPAIEDKIVVYWLGTSYDFVNETSRRTDFNVVMDIQATERMLSSKVEMHIMPVNVASSMKFDYQKTKELFQGKHPLTDFLLQRWVNHLDGGRYERTLWDVALIEAMIHTGSAEQVKVSIFKNGNVWIFKDFDEQFFIQDLYDSILEFLDKL